MNRSNENIISGLVSNIKDLEEGTADDDEQEHSQEDGANLGFLLFFLLYHTQLPLSSKTCQCFRCSVVRS